MTTYRELAAEINAIKPGEEYRLPRRELMDARGLAVTDMRSIQEAIRDNVFGNITMVEDCMSNDLIFRRNA